MNRFYYFTLLIFIPLVAQTQNLDNLKDQEPVKVSGSVNASGVFYNASGIENRRDPFNWFTTGNLNLDIYGWSIPFSFSFSNQNRSFSQPFNRYGITPQYKWVKAYLGYNSMNFSKYTLAGHVFLGAGVELTPGKWQFSAMYGELNKAVPEDTLAVTSNLPAFKRMGYGMKAGYHDQAHSLEVIIFKAEDEVGSIPYVPVQNEVLPKENLVVSFLGRKQLFKRVSLNMEYATSALTHDIRSEEVESGHTLAQTPLFTSRASSQFNNAFNTSIAYNGNTYVLQLNYERIDPGFNTLGAYFFNDDLENLTVSGSVRALKNKLTLGANVGKQKNNLEETEVSSTERVIASFNANYIPDQHWNINATYSNFTTFTNVRPRFDPFFQNDLDTLNFYQVNKNGSMSIGYSFGSRENKQSVLFTGSYQESSDENDEINETNTSYFYNGNLAYRYMVSASGLSVSSGVSMYRSELSMAESTTIGPNISITKSMWKKALRSTLATSYNMQEYSDNPSSKVLTVRLGLNLTPEKLRKKEEELKEENQEHSTTTGEALPEGVAQKDSLAEPVKKKWSGSHRLGLNLIYLNKTGEATTNFNEITATLTYSYSF
ncbi:hypothetical protein C900_02314 [Fulvivirga imtechensis AK7]|uniref:Outer membrane protein beta-barrel domain-containing protein n=1 Tax=Fulvivirga imtechensis AK7 TaxID=1237149 RepID=L8JVU4_9BACT|nr:hypothetical protein [Fulvivirga imtechensis]ELR71729.1 hypothetical protein C900_02314 [Fulvivirga imtechensis AK7]